MKIQRPGGIPQSSNRTAPNFSDNNAPNLVDCKLCGGDIVKGAKRCPHCGKDQRSFFLRYKFLTGFLIILLIGVAVAAMDDGVSPSGETSPETVAVVDKEKPEDEKEEAPEVIEEKTEFALGEIIPNKQFDIVIDNARWYPDLFGESDAYLVADVTITSKKDGFSFFGDMQGVTSDNEVISGTLPFVDADLGEPIMVVFTKKLNDGQKAKGYIAFERDIEFIELRSSMFSNKSIKIRMN